MNLIIKNLKKAMKDSKRLKSHLKDNNSPYGVALIDNIIASQLIALDFAKHDNDMEEILHTISLNLDDTNRNILGIGRDLVYIGDILEPPPKE